MDDDAEVSRIFNIKLWLAQLESRAEPKREA